MNETESVVLQSLDNCWIALCRRMRQNPTADTQRVMNYLGRIIGAAKSEATKNKNAPKQISIEEWFEWLEKQDV